MQPQVRYVKSSDGTRLAVATLGQGQPLVMVPVTYTISIEGLWEIAETRRNLERLAQNRKLVLYDCRGVGLSSRDVEDFSLAALLGDLEVVVDELNLPTLDLYVTALAGPVAISFAANNPDRVRKLVLYSAVCGGRDMDLPSDWRILRELADSNWKLYLQASALLYYGWTDVGRQWADRLFSDVTKQAALNFPAALREADVMELLPHVQCPTLVMHWRERWISLETSQDMAAAIPNARLVTFSQVGGTTLSGDWDSTYSHVVSFLDEGTEAIEEQLPEGTALILFTDIVDSTALTERLGDAAFRDKARELDTALRTIIRENGGKPVEGKLLGDGVLAVFTSARQAIEAALACGKAGDESDLPLHLGIHAGDVISEGKNVYGGAVNIAARIAAISAPGELLVSDTVRSLARTSSGVTFEDRGEQALKGIDDPVRLFAVR
jgi:class 3 adenylate cyclase/pimeloyl-ACP methyl ester carboxylesterase